MALCRIDWHSAVLGKAVGMYVILPAEGRPPFPVFYLLHGLSDDCTIWLRRTRIEWYVRGLPLMVAMPDGGRGFYTNHESGPAWATHLAEELPGFLERHLGADISREAQAVGGLSMGGYGALRLALGYPHRYASATSHSGALTIGSGPVVSERLPCDEMQRIFGKDPSGTDHDLLALARRAREAGRMPRLRLDCGVDDFLIDQNRRFHEALARMEVPHEYEEFPGGHNWDYWDAHVQEALSLHASALRLAV